MRLSFPFTLALLALAPLAASAPQGAQEAAAAPQAAPLPGTWRLVQHTLRDASWGNQPSHTILAPAGWKVEGGAWYPPAQAFQTFASQDITLTSPEGASIEIGPETNFADRTITGLQGRQRLQHMSISDGYMVVHYPATPRAFARFFQKELLPLERPKAKRIKIKEVQEIPELTAQLKETLAPAARQFAQTARMSPGMTSEVDGSVIGIEFEYEEDGQEWTHVIVFAQSHFTFETPSVMAAWGDTGRDRHTSWSVGGNLGLRAPKGQIENLVHVATVVRGSLRPTMPWLQMQARHQAKIRKINHEIAMDNLRTAARISQISSRANSEIMDMQREGFERRNAIDDEVFAKEINSIQEVHEYSLPGEDLPVALPSYYDRVFSNGNGEFILTNDANYEPGSDSSLSGDWQSLRRVR